MKKIAAILAVMILLSGFTFKDYKPQKYATLGSYIYNLIKTSEIEINFIRAPKASEYFGDIKDSDYYAGTFINAGVSGILRFPQKRIYPWKWIKVSDAKLLMDKAYMYKTNQKIKISNVVFGELIKMSKYRKVKDNHYITSQMEKDIFSIYSKKIAEFKRGEDTQPKPEERVNITKKIINDMLVITLDLGEKPTAGYGINIAGASELGDTIEVYYSTAAPKEGQMVAQVITYPKDEIRLKVSDINKRYSVTAKKIEADTLEDVKYFTQVNRHDLKLTLSLGEKPTGGYSIEILEAREVGEKIMVKYSVKTPAEGEMVTQAVTYPSDSVDIRVRDIKRRYDVSLERVTAVNTNNDGVKSSIARVNEEYIEVTLDWGEKPTGGYSIKILEAKQVGDTIEVRYETQSPAPGAMVIQVLTYPKDSVKVKVDDANRDFEVVLVK